MMIMRLIENYFDKHKSIKTDISTETGDIRKYQFVVCVWWGEIRFADSNFMHGVGELMESFTKRFVRMTKRIHFMNVCDDTLKVEIMPRITTERAIWRLKFNNMESVTDLDTICQNFYHTMDSYYIMLNPMYGIRISFEFKPVDIQYSEFVKELNGIEEYVNQFTHKWQYAVRFHMIKNMVVINDMSDKPHSHVEMYPYCKTIYEFRDSYCMLYNMDIDELERSLTVDPRDDDAAHLEHQPIVNPRKDTFFSKIECSSEDAEDFTFEGWNVVKYNDGNDECSDVGIHIRLNNDGRLNIFDIFNFCNERIFGCLTDYEKMSMATNYNTMYNGYQCACKVYVEVDEKPSYDRKYVGMIMDELDNRGSLSTNLVKRYGAFSYPDQKYYNLKYHIIVVDHSHYSFGEPSYRIDYSELIEDMRKNKQQIDNYYKNR